MTDASGVDWANTPRIYYKKSTDANAFVGNTSSDNGWKYTTANVGSSPTNFTLDYSLLQSPVILGDNIQYFIVAQDLAGTPNVGINSGIFTSAPSSVNLQSPQFPITGTINNYYIVGAPLSGTYNVGLLGFNKATGKKFIL
jgi:hypothetical protein